MSKPLSNQIGTFQVLLLIPIIPYLVPSWPREKRIYATITSLRISSVNHQAQNSLANNGENTVKVTKSYDPQFDGIFFFVLSINFYCINFSIRSHFLHTKLQIRKRQETRSTVPSTSRVHHLGVGMSLIHPRTEYIANELIKHQSYNFIQ